MRQCSCKDFTVPSHDLPPLVDVEQPTK